MVRKTIALAIMGMVALTGPALAADAKASAAKAVVKADAIQRASLPQNGDRASDDDYALWLWLTFGLVTTGVVLSAWNDDKKPHSP